MRGDVFDGLARAAAEADGRPLTRRTAVKLAALAVAVTAPFGATPARAGAAGGGRRPGALRLDPGGHGQLPEEACRECQDRWQRWRLRNFSRCGATFPQPGWGKFLCYQAVFWRFQTGMIEEGCAGRCTNTNPPEPVPQPPISPQPTPPVSDDCLNCMSVGGKCCPPSGPLCACANATLPCSRYGCAGD